MFRLCVSQFLVRAFVGGVTGGMVVARVEAAYVSLRSRNVNCVTPVNCGC
jgi:hypothetical protein